MLEEIPLVRAIPATTAWIIGKPSGMPPGLHRQDRLFQDQLVDALDEAGRIVELAAFGEQRLVEQYRGPVV